MPSAEPEPGAAAVAIAGLDRHPAGGAIPTNIPADHVEYAQAVIRTIRQSLSGRVRLSDGLLIFGAVIAAGSVLLWDWHSRIAFPVAGLFVMVIGAALRLRVRCPKCTYMLGRPVNFCPNCGVNFDNPRY